MSWITFIGEHTMGIGIGLVILILIWKFVISPRMSNQTKKELKQFKDDLETGEFTKAPDF